MLKGKTTIQLFDSKTINMTAGYHTITISKGSTDNYAPLVASINIKYRR